MKILLVAPKSSFADQFKSALRANGANIFYLNDRDDSFLPGFLKNNIILWRITRRIQFLRVLNNNIFAERLLNKVFEFKPDLIFFSKVMIVKKDTLIKIKSLGIKTANWMLENINNEPYKSWFINNLKFYDYFFIFDSGAKEMVKNEPGSDRIFYLPMAINPEEYSIKDLSEADSKKYSCDVCFVGAFYPERERFLKIVKNLGVNLKIYGWKGWEKSSLAFCYHGPLNTKESIKLYNSAKICLNINLEPPVKGVNFKTFEISAAGGFQLSDFREDVYRLFNVGDEIEIFKTEDELTNKIKFYLSKDNDNLRKKIADAGKSRVFKDHTFDNRVREIFNIIAK